MSGEDVDSQGSGRATIRDVLVATGQVRDELRDVKDDIGGRLDRLSDRVDTVVSNHEHRITVGEQQIAALAQEHAQLVVRVDAHGHDIGVLKDRVRADEAASDALSAAGEKKSKRREHIILGIGALGGAGGAIATLLLVFH